MEIDSDSGSSSEFDDDDALTKQTGFFPDAVDVRGTRYVRHEPLGSGGVAIAALYKKADENGDGENFVVLKTSLKDSREPTRRQMVMSEAFVYRTLYNYALSLTLPVAALPVTPEVREQRTSYLVLPWISGSSLDDVLREGRLDGAAAMHFGYKAAKGLVTMHEKTIVHCDVKPGNIILTPEGDVQWIDFNLSRVDGNPRLPQHPNTTRGTYSYMAPEQWAGVFGRISSKTDVYAFGHTLYEAATGSPLIGSTFESPISAMYLHQAGLKKTPKGNFEGSFAPALDALPDAHLRELLQHMVLAASDQRWTMTQVRDYLAEQSTSRGINPDAPLFDPLTHDDSSFHTRSWALAPVMHALLSSRRDARVDSVPKKLHAGNVEERRENPEQR